MMPMKSRRAFRKNPLRWGWASLLALFAAAGALCAADTNAPPALTPEQMFEGGTNAYTNWIDFSAGGAWVRGNHAQFQQQQQTPAEAFGGVSDFHFLTGVATNTTLILDGHAIADAHDYQLKLGIEREKVGYLRLSYDQSRTWSDGDGGFSPGLGQYYAASNSALALDRGKLTLEAGWMPEKGPKATFKYTHSFRDGEEGSTEWGQAHPVLNGLPQGLSPAFETIHEYSDSFQLDVTHHIKATDLGLGVRYESGKLDDALNVTEYPGEPVQQKITGQQGTTYDLFNVHTYTETWVKSNVLFSTGFSYSGLGNDFSGSRVYGNDFDVGYSPLFPANGYGYYALTGSSHLHEYVFDLNLLYKLSPHFSIVPSLRVDQENWTGVSSGMETLDQFTAVPTTSDSSRGLLDLRERLDLNYNGLTNWAFYARGDFTEADGNLDEAGGLVQVPPIGGEFTNVLAQTEDHHFYQKYSAGARWYPSRTVTLDVGGYYKYNQYHTDLTLDSTPNGANSFNTYPAYLVMQDFKTYDANVRLTLRPWPSVTAVSRYEFQLSTIDTEPDPVSTLPDMQTSKMTSHIMAQDISWLPWSRLSLQCGINYVLSTTHTPASDVTQAILDSQNNYWMMNLSSGLVLDNKTDLNLSYLYYISSDYSNNSSLGVPYGAGSEEHAITATLTRRLSKNMRVALKYGYYHYNDGAYGGNQDFRASLISATLRYRF
jgi:hypothetical protein